MSANNLVEKAIAIALEGHKDKKDKSGLPYILHPLRVMLKMDTDEEMIPAVLHDILEDTKISESRLLAEDISADSIVIIKSLTKNVDDDYLTYVQKIKSSPIAVKIKKADITDNINLLRLPRIHVSDLERLNNYIQAFKILSGVSE
jgi:(p)ppGpp synthase/HD superfamily hydrolase